MVESCCIQQIFIELPEIAGIESSDFLKAEKAVNHKDQPLRIVIYPKTNIPLPTILSLITMTIKAEPPSLPMKLTSRSAGSKDTSGSSWMRYPGPSLAIRSPTTVV